MAQSAAINATVMLVPVPMPIVTPPPADPAQLAEYPLPPDFAPQMQMQLPHQPAIEPLHQSSADGTTMNDAMPQSQGRSQWKSQSQSQSQSQSHSATFVPPPPSPSPSPPPPIDSHHPLRRYYEAGSVLFTAGLRAQQIITTNPVRSLTSAEEGESCLLLPPAACLKAEYHEELEANDDLNLSSRFEDAVYSINELQRHCLLLAEDDLIMAHRRNRAGEFKMLLHFRDAETRDRVVQRFAKRAQEKKRKAAAESAAAAHSHAPVLVKPEFPNCNP